MAVRIASPSGYGPSDADVERLLAAGLAGAPFVTARPTEAAKGADAVHTDVWASMGHEDQAETRHRAFEGFTVDDEVMAAAVPDALFLHCLPAHRGEEVAASVVDGPQSRVIPQAHNRLHAFRAVLRFLLEHR
jgi:ornithine carbamoyltransferase